jgi:hypothetical protein
MEDGEDAESTSLENYMKLAADSSSDKMSGQ